ncbi:hypothetical protein TNCV_3047431 [Trichonephila clavipes]|nr:hypothetical protein TNCV_3047431 [Trichonephila clavipes]
MFEWIVEKRRGETCTSCCPMCLHKRRLYTIDAYTAGVNVEAISSSTFTISTALAADALAPSLIHSVAFILLRSRHCLIQYYGVLVVPFDCSWEALSDRIQLLYLDFGFFFCV